MRTFKPTVTHLTPAMGQILVGGAGAEFPSLRNAFFVGDQLIKRDCRLLQALAPNCRIINMFGTMKIQECVYIGADSSLTQEQRKPKGTYILELILFFLTIKSCFKPSVGSRATPP